MQLGKALHQHSHTAKPHPYIAGQELKAVSYCAVCDFHFSKDYDHDAITCAVPAIRVYALYICHFRSFLTASIGLVYADRGPPVLA